jgi:hypothetical protein
MKAALVFAALLLAACSERPSPTAVDQCELKEYLEECEVETATKTEQDNCKRKARLEATRVAAGIAPECREKGS